jgi:hypothetical protein
MVTDTVEVFEHPLASVPVTIYVVLIVGSAVTVIPDPEVNPVVGLQEYEVPPPAVSSTDCPLQRTGADGLAVITGNGFTVTVTLVVLLHPLASVPVMV